MYHADLSQSTLLHIVLDCKSGKTLPALAVTSGCLNLILKTRINTGMRCAPTTAGREYMYPVNSVKLGVNA
ncbi:hypothetical protein B9Q09_00245 [Candidatus Marsarchaeota G2 archaeon ECH_B_SAG-C16]|uniref:Uncharacterized protein n=1 Tax=Candidatus Marsarchaeota G2 archaeon ECH_B_SAG-C16 TaxID=1978163 RepID=A0A2R6BGY9_9ARCH|nr:MAG: hypothetical protein B9Q09_00245 [Candidatus Marsarchaeota G2 archaeon ECH_B_SAG-C16]